MLTSHDRQIVATLAAATRAGLRALQGTPGDHVAALKRLDRAQDAAFAFMGDAERPPAAVDDALRASYAAFNLLSDALLSAAHEMRELDPDDADALAMPEPAAHRAH
jgi:hypothetical protein